MRQRLARAGGAKCDGGGLELVSRRRNLPSLHSERGRRDDFAFGIFHLLHAVSAGGQPGDLASLVRVSDPDLPADRHGGFQCRGVRRRVGGGRSRADVAADSTAEPAPGADVESAPSAVPRGGARPMSKISTMCVSRKFLSTPAARPTWIILAPGWTTSRCASWSVIPIFLASSKTSRRSRPRARKRARN